MSDDLLVPAVGIGPERREFEPIESALAGEGLPLALAIPIMAKRIFLADDRDRTTPSPPSNAPTTCREWKVWKYNCPCVIRVSNETTPSLSDKLL